ncbi:MAG: outer membrane beta-barrel protein [Reyranella sp.]|nr:outer membrane beta-barrel protein [Reyranella sp.]
MAINANRSQLLWSPVLGWVLLSCVVSGAEAQIETPTPALQTIEELEISPADLLPVPEQRVLGDELGTTLGAFTLYPSIALMQGFDDNVFASSPATTPPVGSPFTTIQPRLELKSMWLNHSISLLATGGFGFYTSAPTQNFVNYGLQVSGKLDIRDNIYATGLIAYRRSTEALGTPNVAFAQAPTVADTLPIEINFYQRFNRFFYQLTGAATRYWYYDFSTITSLGLPGLSRDRTEFDERIRLGYEITDDTSVFIAPTLNQRIYVQQINIAGQQRDSRSWGVNFGATTRLSEKSMLEGFVGFQSLSYIYDGTTTGTSVFGLTGTWNGYEPLTIRPQILRSINESALTNYQNFINTAIGADFTYNVHGPWQAVGGASYNSADYTPAFGVPNVNPRTDYFVKGSIGVMYSLRPQVMIGPLYEYTQGWSTDVAAGGPSFTRNMFSIRLTAAR